MRVLVAEDGVMMRKLLVRTLENWQYDVVEAEHGKIAWDLFQENPCQLVLTDWMMPEMDGLELIRCIRSSEYERYVYIILLTAMKEKDDLVVGMEAGADDFLVKPVDHNELRVRLRAGERVIRLESELAAQNRQLRETQAALVQSEKLASLGQMAAGMAHEINNPVAIVANNLSVLKRDVAAALELLELYRSAQADLQGAQPDVAEQTARLAEELDYEWFRQESPQLFDKAVHGLGRIRDIVQNLRQFARLDEADLDELDVNAALEAVAGIVQHESDSRQIKLEVQAGDVPPVLCEPAKIQQVLHILVMNALQASDEGSTVLLRSSGDEENVFIDVEDRGCGIENANLEKVFEPFYTTRPVGSGQGLGLSIAQGIVSSHGGTIEVSSEVGEGSTFRIILPSR